VTIVIVLIAVQVVAIAVAAVRWAPPVLRRRRHARRLEGLESRLMDARRTGPAAGPGSAPSALQATLDDVAGPPHRSTPSVPLPPLDPGVGLRDVLDALTGPAPEPEPTDE
jgi:hypothetical protein